VCVCSAYEGMVQAAAACLLSSASMGDKWHLWAGFELNRQCAKGMLNRLEFFKGMLNRQCAKGMLKGMCCCSAGLCFLQNA